MPIRSELRFISLNNIKSGMMIKFGYTKKTGESNDYTVLVVDPKRQNEHATEPQLHGFIIDELSDTELIDFFASFKKTINIDYSDRRASVVEDLNTDEAYTTFLSSKYVKNRSYRTFNLSSMFQVRQVLLGSVD